MQYLDRDYNQTIYELKSGSYKKGKILAEETFLKVLWVQRINNQKGTLLYFHKDR